MVLYILYNADLLEAIALLLNEDSVSYIDDAIAVTFGKDFYETVRILMHTMNRENSSFNWSSSHNSHFKISKLAILHLSQ